MHDDDDETTSVVIKIANCLLLNLMNRIATFSPLLP